MSADFLLEIGCEEIPARMVSAAHEKLKELLERELAARGILPPDGIQSVATPRRLAAYATRLPAAEPDRVNEIVGPPKSVAYTPEGKPARAAESFAAKLGLRTNQLKTVETPKGLYVAAVTRQKGKPARAVLAEVLPGVIGRLSFPRSMYWTSPGAVHFIRPIRWLVALLGAEVIEFSLDGLRSGRVTYGHRLLANKPIRVRDLGDYLRRLREAFVVLDPVERRRRIEQQSVRVLQPVGLRPRADDELLELLVSLVEHPAVVEGEFPREFLALPREVLVTVMRHHQKYLAVEDRRGVIAPHFLTVVDLDGDPSRSIRGGHEAVLTARFRDAQFFWQADQKRPLGERLPLLEEVVFQSRLGSYAQKVERVARLVVWLAREVSADGRHADINAAGRAAKLSKCDLTTEMVREFPELQGVIGGLYARAQGEPEAVAGAIYDHYKPAGPDDALPATLEGRLLALADKLDTVAGCFSVGLAPTGSRDPYAVRRAGTGMVRIVVEGGLRLSLLRAVNEAVKVLREGAVEVGDTNQLGQSVMSFLEERARHLFREMRQFPYDQVNAAFAAGTDDLVDVAARLEAIRRLRPTRNFEAVAVAFKRIRNILEQAGDRGGRSHAGQQIAAELLEEGAERKLHTRFLELRPQVAELRQQHRYEEALRQIASLRPEVDRYFDTVLVMAPDTAVRENRLTLLAHLLREFSTIADFSEIVVKSKDKE